MAMYTCNPFFIIFFFTSYNRKEKLLVLIFFTLDSHNAGVNKCLPKSLHHKLFVNNLRIFFLIYIFGYFYWHFKRRYFYKKVLKYVFYVSFPRFTLLIMFVIVIKILLYKPNSNNCIKNDNINNNLSSKKDHDYLKRKSQQAGLLFFYSFFIYSIDLNEHKMSWQVIGFD